MVLKRSFIALISLVLLLAAPSFSAAGGGQSQSGLDLNDIEDYVEYMVDEDAYFTSGQILSYINAAIRDVIWQTECLSSVTFFELTAGVTEYSISGVSYMMVTDVAWQESGATKVQSLPRGNQLELGRLFKGQQNPESWYERSSRIGIYPVEDADVTGSTAWVTYVPVQGTLLGANTVPTPAALDQALVFYAAARCFARDKQWVAYSQMMNLYAQWIRRYRMAVAEPPPQIKPK